MPQQKTRKKKTANKLVKRLLALIILAAVALAAWIYLVPMMTADAVTTYQSYTTETGDINTQKSFSATLSVKKSEDFSSSEACTVKEIYVHSGDEVKEGDSLILLSTGELFTASFDGVVNEIRVEVGDWIWPNFRVVQICDLQHLEVSMSVDEYDIEELALGEDCTVRVISLNRDFETTISHINRVSSASGSVALYTVTCDLTVPEDVLPGMQATVTLPSEAVTNVTTLDMAALAFDEDQKPYVLLKQADGTYAHQTVETGLSDGMKVEITGGLTSGQTVYAVSRTESVSSPLTLEGIYKALVGEKVVINDNSSFGGRRGNGTSDESGFTPPSGTLPDGTQPDGAANGAEGQPGGDTTANSDTTTTTAAAADSGVTNGTATVASATETPAADATTSATVSSDTASGNSRPANANFQGRTDNRNDGQTVAVTAEPTANTEEDSAHAD